MATRLTDDDLAFLADWTETYDVGDDDDVNGAAQARILAWVAEEQERRQVEGIRRAVAKQTGRKVTTAQARAALAAVRARAEHTD